MRTPALFVTLALACVSFAQEPDSFTVEPPELVPNRSDADANATEPQDVDLTPLQKKLKRAEHDAGDSQHLYRVGIISLAEAEQRALRVIRLQADVAQLQFERAKQQATATGAVVVNGQPQTDKATRAELARLEEAARAAAEKRDQAEIEAAEKNLERQRRLFAVGTGRKSDVNRAEEKLAQLKAQHE